MELYELQILVLDDEPMALLESVQKLSLYIPERNIHRASNAVETMRILKTMPIDIAFIDAEMPDTDGFTVAEYIKNTQPKTQIVFLTGHTELAAKSYDYEPLDFLTKPVDALRLKKTFDRYLARRTPQAKQKERIAVETTTGFVLISPEDIHYIARESRKTVIHCASGDYAVRYSLDEMEATFEEFDLFRCHQSYLVPLGRIVSVSQADFGKTYYACLTDGQKIPVSHNKFAALKKHLKDWGIHFI